MSLPTFSATQAFSDLSAGQLNELVALVVRNSKLRVGPGLVQSSTPDGTTISLAPELKRRLLAAPPTRGTFRLKEIRDDYLVCRELDGDGIEASSDTLVAKPWLAQREPFDGTVRNGNTLTYTNGTERISSRQDPDQGPGETIEEIQIIIPRFTIEDLIYATLEIYTGVETAEGDKVLWQAEYAGRAWTREDGQ